MRFQYPVLVLLRIQSLYQEASSAHYLVDLDIGKVHHIPGPGGGKAGVRSGSDDLRGASGQTGHPVDDPADENTVLIRSVLEVVGRGHLRGNRLQVRRSFRGGPPLSPAEI